MNHDPRGLVWHGPAEAMPTRTGPAIVVDDGQVERWLAGRAPSHEAETLWLRGATAECPSDAPKDNKRRLRRLRAVLAPQRPAGLRPLADIAGLPALCAALDRWPPGMPLSPARLGSSLAMAERDGDGPPTLSEDARLLLATEYL